MKSPSSSTSSRGPSSPSTVSDYEEPTSAATVGTHEAVQPLAASSVVIDQVRPCRIGNSGFAVLTGTFVDAATGGALYTDALAIIAGHFLPTPPPRITYVANTVANGYSFIAVGRNV